MARKFSNRPLVLLALMAGVGCGPPNLVPESMGPMPDNNSDVVEAKGITLVASRNQWFQDQLAPVCTPIHVMVINESRTAVPVGLDELSLTDEMGHRYRSISQTELVTRLFGPTAMPPPDDSAQPPSAPPESTPPPPQSPPPPPSGSQTLAPSEPLEIVPASAGVDVEILPVAGHSVGAVGGGHVGHYGGPGRPGFYGAHPYYPYRRGWYGRGWYGWRGYHYWGPWGWWFAPAFVVGLDAPYGYDYQQDEGYAPNAFETFGPWQIYMLALRPVDLEPRQRMGGLVFFEPAWGAREVTLRLNSQGEDGQPVRLETRFAVRR